MIRERYGALLEKAANDLKALLWAGREEDARLVQKGLLLYRQGLVGKVKILDNDKAIAQVQDVTKVQVELDLRFIQKSACHCPGGVDSLCRHQMAVFFQLYGNVGSVANWLKEWREPFEERKMFQQFGLDRVSNMAKKSETLKPSYDRWAGSFEEVFRSMRKRHHDLKAHLIPNLFSGYLARLKVEAPMNEEWKWLYFLIGNIHGFRHFLMLKNYYGHNRRAFHEYYRHPFSYFINEIKTLINKGTTHTVPLAFDEFLMKLQEDARFLITEQSELDHEQCELYMLLWTKLFKKKTWRQAEREKVAGLLHDKNTIPLTVGTIHLNYLLNHDERAIQLIQTIKERAVPYLFPLLEQLLQKNDWRRMGPYVEMFAAFIKPFLDRLAEPNSQSELTKMAVELIAPYASKSGKNDFFENFLIKTLPYSYPYYDQFLFANRLFEKWVDLQILIGFPKAASIPEEQLSFIMKENPKSLLPLYHYLVQEHIGAKSREHYREAVRKLRGLKEIYETIGQTDEWNHFLHTLLERTKRLRAFHEECKLGNVILQNEVR